MCGIAGFFGQYSPQLLSEMSARLQWRGPDGSGTWLSDDKHVGFAHRRLAILDPRPQGDQPFVSADGRYSLTYNGEIYNYRELRSELVAAGFEFTTDTDSEVLFMLLQQKGIDALKQLNGIFAFGFYDQVKNELIVVRDHLGIKPLYYAETPKGLIFASELKALLADASLDRSIDHQTLLYQLSYMWAPGKHTMFRHIHKLEPGHAIIVRDGKIAQLKKFYTQPVYEPSTSDSFAELQEELRETLYRSVESQMVSDVPIGAFLSGGLDSSAIVAMMVKANPARDFKCYTISLDGENEPGIVDDLPYARAVAAHLNVAMTEVSIDSDSVVKNIERFIFHADEPQGDPAPINALLISEVARSEGTKVLLSGAGGDDIFTGYRRHTAMNYEKYWSWLPKPVRQLMSGTAKSTNTNSALGRRIRKGFRHADMSSNERLMNYFVWTPEKIAKGIFSAELQAEVSNMDTLLPLRSALAELPANIPDIEKMLHLDRKYFLTDLNLNYTDKMSMAAGIEVRVPFLDPRMLEFAARVPTGMKQRGATGKYIFKRAMELDLPKEVIYRPKSGFGAPLARWLRGPLRPMMLDLLAPSTIERRGWFNPEAVAKMIKDNESGAETSDYALFQLMATEIWAQIFLDRNGIF